MKITILVDNNSRIDNYLLAEPGFSLYIVSDNKVILFDLGYTNIFLKNAEKLNLNFDNITDIVISHSHNDHTGGLKFFTPSNHNIKLTAHPNIFDKKFETDGTSYGCPMTKEELSKIYKLNLTKEPCFITNNLLFLGEIPNNISNDIDDTALVYLEEKGLLIITGCAHSGIKNIINYAKKITKIDKIYGIIGGMHLIKNTRQELEELGKFFKNENIELLAPSHCCDLQSKILLSKYINITEVCVGDIFEI